MGAPVGLRWRIVRGLAAGVAAVVGIGVFYVAAALPGALLRPAPEADAPGQQYPLYLVWSDIHTDIILPVRGLSVDWSVVLADGDAPAPPPVEGYVAFGWGSESFFRDVPTMEQLSVQTVARAMFFDTTVVPVPDPALIPPEYRYTMLVSAAELAALEQHVLGTLALTPEGAAEALPQSYGYGDTFYRALGRYNPIRTCNQWTSEGLRLAGVPVGLWTPFSQSITWVLGTDAGREWGGLGAALRGRPLHRLRRYPPPYASLRGRIPTA